MSAAKDPGGNGDELRKQDEQAEKHGIGAEERQHAPHGTVLNVICGVGRVPMSAAVRGVLPFLGAYAVLLGLFILFPQLITVPARILGG